MSQLYVDNIKNRTGGAIGAPSGVVVTGVVTATKFVGSGEGLIGVASTDNIVTGTAATFTGGITANEISVTGNVSIGGTLTYEDVTNIDSVGIVTAQSGIRVGAGQSIGPISGTITYYGDGSQLSGIEVGITTTASSPSANTVVTLNLSSAQHHELNLSAGITTITCSGGSIGESHSVLLIQPTSGIATVGFSTYFLFPSGATPAMSEGGGKIDLLSFVAKQVGAGGTQLLASAGLNYQ
jgi:hypothetical protein